MDLKNKIQASKRFALAAERMNHKRSAKSSIENRRLRIKNALLEIKNAKLKKSIEESKRQQELKALENKRKKTVFPFQRLASDDSERKVELSRKDSNMWDEIKQAKKGKKGFQAF